MKRMFSLLLTVALLMGVTAILLPASAAEAKTVYLSDAGNDTNAGTKDAPVATLLKAYQLLGAEGGTVSIVGTATIVKDPDENTDYRTLCKDATINNIIGKVTITSEDGTGKLAVKSAGIWLPGDTEFTNLVLYAEYTAFNIYLVANCHQLVIGENVTVEKAAGAPGYPIIYGSGMYSVMGWFGETNTSTDVIIKSGTWQDVFGGGCTYHSDWGLVDDVKGNAGVTVEGGVISNLYGGGNGGGNGILAIGGDVTVNVKGGTVGKVIANNASKDAIINGKVTLNITGGTINEITANKFDGEYNVKGGFELNCADEYLGIINNFPAEGGEETNEPTVTDQPTVTDKPISTDAPTATEAPEATNAPEATDAPATGTTAPDTDDTTDAGCASTVGGVLIVSAVACAAAVLCKKKED